MHQRLLLPLLPLHRPPADPGLTPGVVLYWGDFASRGCCLETLMGVGEGVVCYWHLLGGGQRRC